MAIAEYVACSEVVKSIKFILYILETLEIKVELPINVHVDNVGAIFLAENNNSGERTKHVDIWHHYAREVIEDGIIVFVKSEENDSDLYTKNLNGELYQKHSNKVVWDVEEYERISK